MTYRSSVLPTTVGVSPVKALTTSIVNVDKRLRIVEKREATTGSAPAPGTGDLHYVHIQSTPSDTWVVNHNLNKHPAVDVIDTGGSTIIPDIQYNSQNIVTITFGSATSGSAFCN